MLFQIGKQLQYMDEKIEFMTIDQYMDYLEDMEIAKIVKERVTDAKKPIKMISHEEMMAYMEKRLEESAK